MIMLALYGIALPAVLAGLTWAAAGQLWRRANYPSAPVYWLNSLTVPAAFISSYVLLWSWPGWRPLLAEGWLCPLAFAGAIVALAQQHLPARIPKQLLWLALAGFALRMFVQSQLASFSTAEYFGWLGLGTLLIVLVHYSLELISERRPGAAVPLALWIWTAGSALALASTGSLKYGQLAGIFAAILGAALVIAWLQPRFSLANGPLNVLVPGVMGVLICGTLFSDLPLVCAILLACAPAFLWLGELPVIRSRRAWLAVVLRAALVAVPVIVAVAIACWPLLFPAPHAAGETEF